MRGVLNREAYDALNLTCTTTDLYQPWAGPYGPLVRRLYYNLQALRAQTTKRLVCYFPKETWGPETELCHRMGAITLFEVIDNDKRSGIFFGSNYTWKGKPRELLPPPSVDLWLVSTRLHASMLRTRGIRAVAFPHPHTNFDPAREETPEGKLDWRRAGLVASQLGNMPSEQAMGELAQQCCDAGFELTLYRSTSKGIVQMPTRQEWQCKRMGKAHPGRGGTLDARSCEERFAPGAAVGPQRNGGAVVGGEHSVDDLEDVGGLWDARSPADLELDYRMLRALAGVSDTARSQANFYTPDASTKLPAVGLVWDPGTILAYDARVGRPVPTFFSLNRPQTRQIWWWSLGVPTIGSANVQSSVDLARRVGLQSTHALEMGDVSAALRCLRARGERTTSSGGATPTPLYRRLASRARAMAERSTVVSAARDLDRLIQQELHHTAKPAPSTGEDAMFQYYGIPCHCSRSSAWRGEAYTGPQREQCNRHLGCHFKVVPHSLFQVEDKYALHNPSAIFANLTRQLGEAIDEHRDRRNAWEDAAYRLLQRSPCLERTADAGGGGDSIQRCKHAAPRKVKKTRHAPVSRDEARSQLAQDMIDRRREEMRAKRAGGSHSPQETKSTLLGRLG